VAKYWLELKPQASAICVMENAGLFTQLLRSAIEAATVQEFHGAGIHKFAAVF